MSRPNLFSFATSELSQDAVLCWLVHSALAYYWDHREELDLDIRRRLERVEELGSELQHPELAAILFAPE